MFCLFVIYVPIPSKPASTIASSNYGYYQLPPPRILSCLPVSRRATLCWKLLRARSILGVSNHVSAPNNSTACVTALKNVPTPLGLPLLLTSLVYFYFYFASLTSTILTLLVYLLCRTHQVNIPSLLVHFSRVYIFASLFYFS